MKIELAHDYIAKKIYEEASHEDKVRARSAKFFHERYQHYLVANDLLLSKRDLIYIDLYLQDADLSPDEQAFVKASESAIKKHKRKEKLKDALLVVLICAVFFSSWALWERSRHENTRMQLAYAQDSINTLVRNMQDQNVVAEPAAPVTFFSTIHVQGIIRNEAGDALANAMVAFKGATARSKEDGRFKLYLILPTQELEDNLSLQISQVNYQTVSQTIDIDQENIQLDIVLIRD